MSTGKKKNLISSELEDLLKEVEEEHKQTRAAQRDKKEKKKPKLRIDIIIAVLLAVVLVVGVIFLIIHFTGDSSKNSEKQTLDNPLEEEKYPEISDVIKNYMNAFLIEDEQKRSQVLAQYVGNMYDINRVKQRTHVVSYSDIECYTKEGPYDNTYVVYVYYQMELKNIATPAPSIERLYVVRDTNTGNVYIQNDPGEDIKEYMAEVTKDSDVQELLKDVDKEYQEAKDSDERLKKYFDDMNEAANKAKETTAKNDSTKAAETTAKNPK